MQVFTYYFSVAIDMSPAQNSLLELKLAAIRELSHKEFLCLLGEVPGQPDERFTSMQHNKVYFSVIIV